MFFFFFFFFLHKSALLDRQIEKILPNRKIVLQLFLLELAHVYQYVRAETVPVSNLGPNQHVSNLGPNQHVSNLGPNLHDRKYLYDQEYLRNLKYLINSRYFKLHYLLN